jgi:aldose sugar dehydrogenase
VVEWTPSIAPAGMTLYRGEMFPQWEGNLLVSALAGREVRRVVLEGTEVVEQQPLFVELDKRFRDVRTAPDGSIYLLTDHEKGEVLRVTAN